MKNDRAELLKMVSHNTIMYRIHDWIDNFKANLKYIQGGYGVSSLTGVLQGIPAIIVGSGPTLDRNIQHLKDAKGKACIFACDSAVLALLDYGVVPDIVLTTDSHARCKDFFKGIDISQLNFVADSFISPETAELLQGAKRLYWYNTLPVEEEPFTAVLNSWTGFIGNIGTGGCVATTIWCLAVQNMQAPMDILVGLTSGFYDPVIQYSHAVMLHNHNIVEPYKAQPIEDVDMYGMLCYTLPAYQSFAYWFQDSFIQLLGLHINCSEGGIIKENCLQMPLRYCIDKYLCQEFDIEATVFKKELMAESLIQKLGAEDIRKYKSMITVLLDGPSIPNLALRMGITPDAIIDAINELRAAGFNISEGSVQVQSEEGLIEDVQTYKIEGLFDEYASSDLCKTDRKLE